MELADLCPGLLFSGMLQEWTQEPCKSQANKEHRPQELCWAHVRSWHSAAPLGRDLEFVKQLASCRLWDVKFADKV